MRTSPDRPRRLTGALALAATVGALLATGAAPARADTTARVSDGVLHIDGDAGDNRILLTADVPNHLIVDVGEDGTADFTFDTSTLSGIEVSAAGGDDEVRLDTFMSLIAAPVTARGGAGDDTLIGGPNDDLLLSGDGDDVVDGNGGADTVRLGGGADRFRWDPGDRSDVVDGAGGTDEFDFNGSNGSENVDVSANGPRVRFHRDVADVTTDIGGIERLSLRMLGSADGVTVGDLAGTGVTLAHVDLGGFDGGADGAVDTVTEVGTPGPDDVTFASGNGSADVTGLHPRLQVGGAEPANDHVGVATLGGDDAVSSGVTLTGLRAVDVDGGDGNDTVTYHGTAAADAIGIALDGTVPAVFGSAGSPTESTAVERLVVEGHRGDDTIAGQNGIAGLTGLVLQGGPGNDRLLGGDGPDELRGGDGDDLVDGNRGSDVAQLGDGNDVFQWDPGDQSDTVEGGSGTNELDFNGANVGEAIDVSASGPRIRLHRDIADVTTDFAGFQRLRVLALAGADTITIGDLTGTALRHADVDLGGFSTAGDGAADTVDVVGTDRPDAVHVTADAGGVVAHGLHTETSIAHSEPALDTLQVATGGGDDAVTVDPAVNELIATVVDLGGGETATFSRR